MASEQNLSVSAATDLYNAGKLQEAEGLCNEILKISPEDAPASHLLGCIAFKAGEFAPAAQLIGKAVDTDPENNIYKFDLGHVLLNIGQIDDAKKLLGEVVDAEPNNAPALLFLGHALFKLGNQDAAYEKWQLLLSLTFRKSMGSERAPLYHIFNSDKFDFPDYDGERLTYIICSTPRCGSTLLGNLLVQSEDFGVPHEYMNFTDMGAVLAKRFGVDRSDPYCFRSYFDAVKRKRTSPNGVFGIKTQINMLVPLLEPPLLPVIFPNPKFIQILRRDRIAQSVSFAIASQTQKWNSMHDAQKEPVYDEMQIDKCLKNILTQESRWMRFFQIHAIDQHILYYEDLVADSPAVCRGLAAYLGVDTDFGFDIAGADFKKVGTRINTDWEERYRADKSVL